MSDASKPDSTNRERPKHFIAEIVEEDLRTGTWGGRVHTRFPPEPNGYLHVGHAKSICLNHGLAAAYGGKFNLRFDDTNPAKEEQEYVDSIKADVKWLGAEWEGPHGGGLFFASDCFGRMYEFAQELIRKGKAYVCDLTADQVAEFRGPPTRPGRESPFRNRPVDESLDLLARMKAGEFPNGARTLRAKIDMSSPNLNLRDPVLYRILHEEHHNTGAEWCIYPMYDWAHGFEDSIEGITHSICTLEFENHRPLYDWFIDAVNEGRTADGSGPWGKRIHHPRQIEFAKLRPTYTVMSKRNLLKMVQDRIVAGWDDPRMPTISALRRRGYTPECIRAFCDDVGVTKVESSIDLGRLENALREDLNRRTPRRMAVLRPLRVVIENYPDGKSEELDAVNNPEDPAAGTRKVPFSRVLYVERDDFMEIPPKKFFRLAPGVEVRLRYAYFITCTGVVKDPATGAVTELRCTYDPATRGGDAPAGPDGKSRKPKATLHWVSAGHAIDAEVRLFDRLFNAEEPGKRTGNFADDLNPHSLEVIAAAKLEPSLASRGADEPAWPDGIRRFQFERLGYFCMDRESAAGTPVFNRAVTLKDTWAKVAAAM
ncbi:MAG: glutamine--tRNA ligase/YqeY domain fusion protein [Phycisphaerales bacterium]